MRISDWRSDVCSSDLLTCAAQRHAEGFEQRFQVGPLQLERVEFGQAACGTEKLPIDLILEGVEVRAQHIADKARAHLGNTRAPAGRLLIMPDHERSEEHTSELQSLMRISYAVFCLKK